MTHRLLHVELTAPERRNALSREVLAATHDALAGAGADVTGVVLSGHGDAFSAGADFRDITGTTADLDYDDAVAEVTRAIREHPSVVVAAIEGPCMGAAADLALSCDIRVAAEDSWLQIPAARLGLLYNPASIGRLASGLPPDTVRRLLLLGERFSGVEAREAGLVSVVVPPGQALRRAHELLSETTTDHLAAIAATKALLNSHDAGSFDPDDWQGLRRALLDSPQRRAAVAGARRRHSKEGKP